MQPHHLGLFNDKGNKHHPLTGYPESGASLNFQKFNRPMSFYTTIKKLPN